MLALAIDSSTKVGSVSLINDEKLIAESLLNLKLKHSPRLMPQIIDILEECDYQVSDLEGIGVSLGPGSFTGTRIGVSTAKTLAQSLEIPIVGVSILKTLAYSLKHIKGYICPIIDARRNRVFTTVYQTNKNDKLVSQTEESLIEIDNLLEELTTVEDDIFFVGQVAAKYKSKIEKEITNSKFVSKGFNLPRAGALAELVLHKLQTGQTDQLFNLTPNYLKRSQAEIQWEAKNN